MRIYLAMLTGIVVANLTSAAQASETPARAAAGYSQVVRALNPQVSAILQGRAAYLSGGEQERSIPGYLLGPETGRGREGLALGESELVFSANVDDKLYGFFDVSFDEDEIGVEEGYLSTLSLPYGFGLKGGKFLSAIGYNNERHSHTWDFVEPPLVYEAMLGGSLSDAGLQITWIAPTDLYLAIGGEGLRGDAFPAAGARHRGFGAFTLFADVSGDLGTGGSWASGLSYLRAESGKGGGGGGGDGRESPSGFADPFSFDGSSDLVVADFVYKWAPLGNFRERNFTLQAEYMYRHEKGKLDSGAAPRRHRGNQHGFYLQGVYQFMPRYRVGLRYGELWSDNRTAGPSAGVVDWDSASPRRISGMIDFSNSEFSRVRLQYSHESGGLGNDSLLYLQYIISIGSHAAHAF